VRGRPRLLGRGAALLGAAVLLAACGSSDGGAPAGRDVARGSSDWPLRVPLATSAETPSALFAAVPMGHLSQPLETFWQLFVRRPGSPTWLNRTSLGIATNGGLLLAPAASGSLAVGTRPANKLEFSALASTDDGGRSWLALPPVAALADDVSAVAATPGGGVVVLAGGRRGEDVLVAGPGATSASTLVTSAGLGAGTAGRACGLVAIHAVAGSWGGDGPLVGAACGRPGVVGLFVRSGGAWQSAGARLPAELSGKTEVLALFPSRSGVTALVAVLGPGGVSLVAATSRGPSAGWSFSAPLGLGRHPRLVSLGPAGAAGSPFVVWSDGPGLRASLLAGLAGWRSLPAPPAGTETLATTGTVEALSVHDTRFTVWRLRSQSWTVVQQTTVPIEFGSSG